MMSNEITGSREGEKITLSPEDSRKVRELIEDACVETWYDKYRPEGFFVLDGYSWDLKYEVDKNKPLYKYGSNAYPWCFYKLIRAIIIAVPELNDLLEDFAEEKESVY